MKKIIMSLGFAAATIFAAQAQETPQEQQYSETQTEVQEGVETTEQEVDEATQESEEQVEESTQELEQQTEEATQEAEQEVEETESEIDNAVENVDEKTEDVGQEIESGVENAAEDVEQKAEEVGQEVEDAAQDMKQETDDAAQKVEQEADKADPEMENTMQEKPAEKDADEIEEVEQPGKEIEGEGITKITKADLPQEIQDALNNSDYKEATIEQAYELTGAALSRALDEVTTDSVYGEDYEKMYQLQLKTKDNTSAVIYITEDGEVFAENEL